MSTVHDCHLVCVLVALIGGNVRILYSMNNCCVQNFGAVREWRETIGQYHIVMR